MFNDMQCFCFFVGTDRSGHSLVRALLDAHPNVVVANEYDVIRHMRWKKFHTAQQVFEELIRHSKKSTERDNVFTGYKYKVPGQHQGTYDKLLVVGDKQGGGTATQIRTKPVLIQRLRRLVEVPIRVIAVLRNPYDVVSTVALRSRRSLGSAAQFVRQQLKGVRIVYHRTTTEEFLRIYHENLVREPQCTLQQLCGFIGVEVTEQYLQDCASIVYTKPHKSRDASKWSKEEKLAVQCGIIEKFDWLSHYTFD